MKLLLGAGADIGDVEFCPMLIWSSCNESALVFDPDSVVAGAQAPPGKLLRPNKCE
jgi:hypothetical protein